MRTSKDPKHLGKTEPGEKWPLFELPIKVALAVGCFFSGFPLKKRSSEPDALNIRNEIIHLLEIRNAQQLLAQAALIAPLAK